MQLNSNQALTMHPLFFDPIYKSVEWGDINGKKTIIYKDDPWGVQVQENGDVTFQMFAPEAKTVEVAGFGGSFSRDKITLEKQDNGYFTKTVSRFIPGFHYHEWFVDGVKVANPAAPFAYGCFGATNFFEVPDEQDDFWFLKDVPHGDVQIHTYTSQVNRHYKKCYVYTPPTYHAQSEKKYPVMYLQHGVGEDETSWIWNGKMNFILDNLIAEKKCQEMIVVMCCGYAFVKGEDPVFYPGDFDRELTKDVIPYIETHFRVKKGRMNRAMAGLSLGSAQAALTVAKHQNLFAYLGSFSGVKDDVVHEIIANHGKFPMRAVLMTAGTGETGLAQAQKVFIEQFQKLGVNAEQRSYVGYHDWHVWRESLRDFVQMIFQDHAESAAGIEELFITDEAFSEKTVQEEEFIYTETEVPTDILEKQTFAEHKLMFDPIYKGLIFAVDEDGRPAGKYKDEHCGVEIVNAQNGTARFWVRADGAKTVEADIWGMGKFSLEKGEEWWNCEVSGIEKGFHYYSIVVNGTQVVDSNAPVGYGGFRAINYLEMPEPDFAEYRLQQIPHGTVHMNYFSSNVTNRTKLCYVYTPASYDEETEKRYPVLYLQHGGGENEIGWIWQGKIANIADALIAKGEMQEMIIVMNTGYAFPQDRKCHPSLSGFLEEIPDSCVTFIDRFYRTIPKREQRAMAGLSMGGMQTQRIVFSNLNLFAWAGIFSGGLVIQDEEVDYRDILLDEENFKKFFKLLYVACGTKEFFYESTKASEEEVISHHVPIEVFEDYGYHDWTFWRHCVVPFLTKLFK